MLENSNNYINHIKRLEIGQKFFYFGIAFLPSALPIGLLLLIISLLFCLPENRKSFLKDKWNVPILLSIGIILVSSINNSLFYKTTYLRGIDTSLIWLNLFNWIPTLIFFHSFQIYLETKYQRINFAKSLIIGTFPVILSCILQTFLNINGPFETLNGIIVWFQRPIEITGGVTGLFNNPNYLAFWFSIILPFTLIFQKLNKNKLDQIILFFMNFLIIFFLLMTNSRNGLISIIIILFYLLNIRKILLIIFGISTFVFSLLLLKLPISLTLLSTNNLFQKIFDFNFYFQGNPRIIIWKNATKFISERPFWGWGPSTFPFLNENKAINLPLKFIDAQHTHNMPLELAHNFGIPLAFIIFTTLLVLFLKVYKEINKQKNDSEFIFNKCWFLSSSLVILLHLTDITYYDGKISLVICIFFAGMRSILRDLQSNLHLKKTNNTLLES